MVDLHTHLLHGIDDGATQLDLSIEYLKMEQEQGVDTVVLTPHLKPEQCDIATFLLNREEAYQALLPHAKKLGVELVLGCELLCDNLQKVQELDLQQLTIGESQYILVEFLPTVSKYSLFTVVEGLTYTGLTPILAHVERYNVLNGQPDMLYQLIEMGALLQVNSKTIIQDKGYYRKCLKKGLVQLIASDTHATDKRPANLKEGYDALASARVDVAQLQENTAKIVAGEAVDVSNCRRMRTIGKFYI